MRSSIKCNSINFINIFGQYKADSYLNFAWTVTKAFCNSCSRKVKTKQHRVSCTTCQARFHKLYTNINNIIKKI